MTDRSRPAWEEMAPGIAQRVLHTSPATGARTLLLRSTPRPWTELGDHRPQYHPVDEEFLCLEGRFTLEGTHWLTPLTYVYYPAGLVHGFHVDVPRGYEIYLRNSGPYSRELVEAPAQNKPYLIDRPDQAPNEVIVADCSELTRDAMRSRQLAVITLRRSNPTGEGALIVCLPAGGELQLPIAEPADYAEMFVLEGDIQLRGGKRLGTRSYAFAAGSTSLHITAMEPTSLMLNYRGAALPGKIAQQAGSVHRASNAYP